MDRMSSINYKQQYIIKSQSRLIKYILLVSFRFKNETPHFILYIVCT